MKATDYLALYGALLSTCVAIWNFLKARAVVRVKIIYSLENIGSEPSAGISIVVQNPSGSEVHISGISFLYQYGAPSWKQRIRHAIAYRRFCSGLGWCYASLRLYDIDDGCPMTLSPGRAHRIFVPEATLNDVFERSQSKRFKVSVQDELWRNTRSKTFEWR